MIKRAGMITGKAKQTGHNNWHKDRQNRQYDSMHDNMTGVNQTEQTIKYSWST